MREEVRERAKQLIGEISEEYGIEIIEIEVMAEHIHLLVSFPPSMSIGDAVRIIKSKSAIELFREFPGLKKRLWSGEMWEDGYFARTVGDRMTREEIERYIKHHRDLEQGPAQLELNQPRTYVRGIRPRMLRMSDFVGTHSIHGLTSGDLRRYFKS